MKHILVIPFILLVCISCKKENVSSVIWTDYCPMSVGNTRIYECTSINIDVQTNTYDTSVYLIKENIAAIVSDTLSHKVFAINCEKQNKNETTWNAFKSLAIQQYDHEIIRVEDNIPYVVLKFPATTNFSWDMNKYNTSDEKLISFSDINTKDTVLDKIYDSVLVVLQEDFKSLYTYEFSEERYAKNIGLTYKQVINVESQPNHAQIDLSNPIEDRITKGTITTYRLKQSLLK